MVERRFSAASSMAFWREPGFNPAALRLGYGIHQAGRCSSLILARAGPFVSLLLDANLESVPWTEFSMIAENSPRAQTSRRALITRWCVLRPIPPDSSSVKHCSWGKGSGVSCLWIPSSRGGMFSLFDIKSYQRPAPAVCKVCSLLPPKSRFYQLSPTPTNGYV